VLKKTTLALGVGILALAQLASAQTSTAGQIAAALQAAPEDRKADATVLGLDASGATVTLRQGTNDLVCMADNPKVEGISVACYHKDLDPFMARGRQMTAQGITEDKVRDQTRWKEVEAGTLKLPREPRMLYVASGKSYDEAANKIEGLYLRSVIYVPFATAASTGLGTKPVPGVPWLMDPGTAGAHIMISPPRP